MELVLNLVGLEEEEEEEEVGLVVQELEEVEVVGPAVQSLEVEVGLKMKEVGLVVMQKLKVNLV